ncbi:hypothetical protein D9M73_280600 [compost metagenome]
MDGFHQAVEAVERKQHGVRRIATGNNGEVRVVYDVIDDFLQVVAGIRETDYTHDGTSCANRSTTWLDVEFLCLNTRCG